ncbi:MAG: FG-GAP repeat protein [Methanomicrobiaceae archaeon]|nr:FG-GAP repeat protein [Methanomicrobiaceae archaeon]
MTSIKKELSIVILVVFLAAGVGIASADRPAVTAAGGQGPCTEFRLTPGEVGPDAEYGRSVAIDGDLVAVGAVEDDAGGAVYLYRRQGMAYVPVAKLVAPDATSGAEFGRSVAIKGNTVIVGARFARVGDLERAGAVYIFKNNRGSWQFEEKISSPEPADEDNFGRALAVWGNTLVVTARKDAAETGAAYVFVNRGKRWIYTAELMAGDAAEGDYFGQSVALQGDIIAIGARNTDEAGGLYLFRRSGDGWREIARVTPPDGRRNDQYGFTVAIAGDTIAVSARRADPDTIKDAGEVYVYSLTGDGVRPVARLTAGDASAGDEFGQSIAIAGDTIAVGAWKADIGENDDQGAIYLFRRAGTRWIETAKITASDGAAGDEFGYSLAAFGTRMVTGAHFADQMTGAAYVLPLKP